MFILVLKHLCILLTRAEQTMANSGLRPIIAPHLSLPHYILLRVFAPLIAYIPLSLSFAMISLPFHVPFHAKYTEAQGFFLFWIICYILMGGVGLATEFAIGVLTIRFAPFFLVTLVSCSYVRAYSAFLIAYPFFRS